MNFNHLLDLIVVVVSVVTVAIASVYAKYKLEIDKRAAKGNLVAKAEQIAAQAVTPLVYQAEKRGGSGEEKLNFVLNAINMILALGHLPALPASFIKGLIEKAVETMRQAQSIIDVVDKPKPNKTIVANFNPDNKSEQ